ncbi:sodium potassium-transporting atpase subunit beta-1 [Limosa lapponica baueri]|uniref:Sodium potassium-transporting atpase subunit beta-1 n=1 Tax=Limosa lapponica baueri TaxID=1758121 RepID=A0A2I0TXC2_LIMLA|nr:sodium potassium-transporting atpase subunit beta-1 [Limosa lapponica baueri]
MRVQVMSCRKGVGVSPSQFFLVDPSGVPVTCNGQTSYGPQGASPYYQAETALTPISGKQGESAVLVITGCCSGTRQSKSKQRPPRSSEWTVGFPVCRVIYLQLKKKKKKEDGVKR